MSDLLGAPNISQLSNASSMGATSSIGSSSIVIIIAICIALFAMLVGAWIYYNRWSSSPWWSDRFAASSHSWDWLTSLRTRGAIGPYGSVQMVTPPEPSPVAPPTESISERNPNPKQSWCFVGEDLTGRYCVLVPTPESCPTERRFQSRGDCELTSAMHLPAGIAKNQGIGIQPLSTLSFA